MTKHKEMEKELRETAKRYQMLFESAGDSIFILKAGGEDSWRIIAANQAASRMHGYTIPELLSMKISDLDTKESAQKIPVSINQIMREEWIKFEVEHIRKDGSEFPVEVTAGLMEIDGTLYILAFDRDISERKQVEDYIEERSHATFTHGICAECLKKADPVLYEELSKDSLLKKQIKKEYE